MGFVPIMIQLYPSRRTQWKVEDNGNGHEKLLVVQSNKGSGRYIDRCDACQQYKNGSETSARK